MKTVIYHSADFDGIFCREIARHFLGEKDVQYIGWNFGDAPVKLSEEFFQNPETVYVMDLPPDKPFGLRKAVDNNTTLGKIIWIDHHKTAIETHSTEIPGYRIDGVAACRLAWQWFIHTHGLVHQTIDETLPKKQDFLDRKVSEPLAVRFAGEYDVWDKRHEWTDKFQFGLRLREPNWALLLETPSSPQSDAEFLKMVNEGEIAQTYAENMDAVWLGESGHIIEWEGLKFLAKNTVERGSNMFLSKDVLKTGHDALLAYGFRGKVWTVSLYHAKHRTDLDLSQIAVKYGGGGHAGAAGFVCNELPFSLP